MSVIVQQPDSLSFAGNLKKFVVTSGAAVSLQLNKGAEQILNEIYQPGAGSIVEIDLRAVIDKVLSVILPGANLITEQSSGVADFTATIDGTAVAFRVIKGGVLELAELASAFADDHFLTWQIQDKKILQIQPEWITVYTNVARNLKAKAYYQDNTNASMLLTALAASKLLAVDVSWASINALFVKKNPIAWDVWFEDTAGTRLSYVQRYCLRNSDDEEKIFVWANTLGGIDTISLTGSAEDDLKLEHLIAEMGDESLQEYQTDKKREIKQSTGFLTVDESRWIEDFFYSGRRYLVSPDGSVKPIVLASSKVVSSTADDLFDYEFSYRLSSDSQLLNLDRSFESLPALEVPADFFLTELLSGLPVAQYSDSLLMAVQSPFAQAWQKLSMAQLWGSALPTLIDGVTISFVNGKLQVNGVSGGVGVSKWGELAEKPIWTEKLGWDVDNNRVTVSSDLYITGKLVVDGTIQFFGSGAGGTGGGGGASALWELTDVADDMQNSLYGDIPMYNGTHFSRYNISNFANVNHTHAGLYRAASWVPFWAEVSDKPTWTEKFGWDGTAVTVSTDMHVAGKLVVDGTIQFFGSGAGGTGGGGSSTLWGLSDVSDDVANSVYGDLIMYNGTHFARINQSVLAPAVHYHTIAQVNGLQSALDGKQAAGSYVLTSDGRLSDARPASDVYAWAKAAIKPAYNYSEIGSTPPLNYLPLVGGTLTGGVSSPYLYMSASVGSPTQAGWFNSANYIQLRGATVGFAINNAANSVTNLRILDNGIATFLNNLGVGITPFPTCRLQVNTGADRNLGIQASTTLTDGIKFNSFSDDGAYNKGMEFAASAYLFGVGSATFAGNIITGGTMQFYTASDRRLKTDFEPITNPIDKIKSLTGYFFNYTDQAMQLGGYTNRRDIGLIAQDVHAILPEATGTLWNTDFMGYKADKLVPLFVEGFKSHDITITQMTMQIQQLQNEIDELKRQRA